MLLTFDFKTVEEAQEFLAGLIAKPQPVCAPRAPCASAIKPAKDSIVVTKPEPAVGSPPKKRGPKPKAEKAAEEALAKVYGIEDCRTALSGLFDVKGRDAAKAALAEFKVARIGELAAGQYRGFVVLCETLSQPE